MKVGGGATLQEAAAASIAKEIDVAVVGLGTTIETVTDENLRYQESAELMDLTGIELGAAWTFGGWTYNKSVLDSGYFRELNVTLVIE